MREEAVVVVMFIEHRRKQELILVCLKLCLFFNLNRSSQFNVYVSLYEVILFMYLVIFTFDADVVDCIIWANYVRGKCLMSSVFFCNDRVNVM